MAELKKVLVAQLQDPSRSVEEHEKTLECVLLFSMKGIVDFYLFYVDRTLLEFQSNDEALWIYFDSHSNHIMERMNSEHSSSIKVVEGMKPSFFSSRSLKIGRISQRLCGTANDLLPRSLCRSNYKMRCHFSKRRRTTCCWVCALHPYFRVNASYLLCFLPAKSASEPAWQAVLDLVKNVSETISSSLPSFWTLSKNFIDGKYKKVC